MQRIVTGHDESGNPTILYEGDDVSVYEYGRSGFNKALSVGCGL